VAEVELEEDEWLHSDLVGMEVVGVGKVERVLPGPSCDVLEVGEVLIPFIKDAIKHIGEGRIEVNAEFLGLRTKD
jgi:ribosomal 30S subunit maturation factor RimM